MGFRVHVYLLFLLGKLQVIQEHPVIKCIKERLKEQMHEVGEMCPRSMACCIMTEVSVFYYICLLVINYSVNRGMCGV